MRNSPRKIRAAFSLLELVLTAAMMATLAVAVSSVLRSSLVSWEAYEGDADRLQAAQATLRHMVRRLRQADEVVSLTDPSNPAGELHARLADGQTVVWRLSGGEVRFGAGSPDSLLAGGIDELSFTGYEADGVTPTTNPADVRSVLCTVRVTLDVEANSRRISECRAWLRAW